MPKGTRVAKCVADLGKKGSAKGTAIPICQASTHQSYATGKTTTKSGKPVAPNGIKRKRRAA